MLFYRVCLCSLVLRPVLNLCDKVTLLDLTQERGRCLCHLHKGIFIPTFRQIREGRQLFVHLLIQLPSAQNNSYAKVACFRLASSGPIRKELFQTSFLELLEVP